MHILFLSHYFPPEGNAPASRVHACAKHWVARGHTVTVITGAPNVPNGVVYPGYKNKLIQKETIDGIQVIRVWTFIAANRRIVKRTLNYLSYMFSATWIGLFQKRPDVLIATSPQFFCGWAGLVLSRLKRVPFVLEIRDIWPESIFAVGARLPGPALKIVRWMEQHMYKTCTHLVTVGEGYRQRLLEKGVPDDKMSVIMNGLDTDLFAPREGDPALRSKLGIPEGAFVCSYIGTIGMACGLDVVLNAAEQLRARGVHDVVFLLVGDGARRERLETLARERMLETVVFTGRVDKEDIPGLVALSDACLVHLKKTDLFETVMPSKITPFLPHPIRSKGGFKALPPKAIS